VLVIYKVVVGRKILVFCVFVAVKSTTLAMVLGTMG